VVVLGSVAVCALVALVVIRHVEQNRVMHVGNAVIAIEGRDIHLTPWNGSSVGVGVGGRLGLVAGRCVGFVDSGAGGDGVVIVWPSGTRVSGHGEDLRITSEGKTVRLGDEVSAGSEFGHDFSGIREKLPADCRKARLVQVGLGS